MDGVSDRLIIGYDKSSDGICLIVARKYGRGLKVINTFYGDEAERIYNLLMVRMS